jgi:hypothetical protein
VTIKWEKRSTSKYSILEFVLRESLENKESTCNKGPGMGWPPPEIFSQDYEAGSESVFTLMKRMVMPGPLPALGSIRTSLSLQSPSAISCFRAQLNLHFTFSNKIMHSLGDVRPLNFAPLHLLILCFTFHSCFFL